jgi:hypothetical protein
MANAKTPEASAETAEAFKRDNPSMPEVKPAEFTWDQLAAPTVMPSKRVAASNAIDVLKEVPESIRVRAEVSLADNVKAVAKANASTAVRPRPDYEWRVQPVPTTEIGVKFRQEIARYAKYRPADKTIPHMALGSPVGQVTARTGEPSWYANDAAGIPQNAAQGDAGAYLGVRYSVRPFEDRKGTARAPGTV